MESLHLPLIVSDVTAVADWHFRECARAIRQITRYRPGPPWLRRAKRTGLIVLFLGSLFLLFGVGVQGWAAVVASLPWLLVILLWVVILSGGYSWITAWQIKRSNPHMVAGQEHHVSPQGYRVRCGAVTSTTTWEGVQRFVETPDFFLVYPVRNAAYYLPKRCLSDTDAAVIRTLAQTGISDKSAMLAV